MILNNIIFINHVVMCCYEYNMNRLPSGYHAYWNYYWGSENENYVTMPGYGLLELTETRRLAVESRSH